ncbi:MAG: hypothetical protein COV10_04375 [Candidatus Vogelbacteria bacterium CG10_big_fil_rev_8_21_14_0_10_51_16]|uniref:DUF4349 domain-containing protein n=1 Tax=Candidatus Vogelbacteria bacterium CG10_big_fil_rev_8_21_14_0_10_51_16 TaxID=1975045 RepID=A0A2H0RD42_9BACT|nr:MAG: hypothetical protein COV10_04375 [Candidatus Vogelbacteria bacterium CG10_big_fil_rev_8_21_14_0_10_51_16]
MATATQERVIHVSKRKFFGAIIVLIIIGLVATTMHNTYGSYGLFDELVSASTGIGVILSVLWLIWGLGTNIINGPVDDPEKNKRLGRKRMILGLITFLVIGLLWVLVRFLASSMGLYDSTNMMSQEIPYVGTTVRRPGPEQSQPDITDTREFLKMSYSANLKSRDVRNTARNVKSIIREADGRVDSEQVTDKHASLRFVVPQTRFESFRAEVESLTHKKLYVENVSSENLLSQKQNIERATSDQSSYLADLQLQKQTLANAHAGTSATYQRELASVLAQLVSVRESIRTAQTSQQRALFEIQETTLVARESTLRQNIDSENKTYAIKSADLANQIASAEKGLTNLGQQDTDLMNKVATVTGSIDIAWVSLWAMAVLISPLHPAWIILIVLLLLWWLGRLAGLLPRIELV